jgi:hypothetical protein
VKRGLQQAHDQAQILLTACLIQEVVELAA